MLHDGARWNELNVTARLLSIRFPGEREFVPQDCLENNGAPPWPEVQSVMALVRCHRLNSADIAAMILRGLFHFNAALGNVRRSMGAQEMLEDEIY